MPSFPFRSHRVQPSVHSDFTEKRTRKRNWSDRILEVPGFWELNEGPYIFEPAGTLSRIHRPLECVRAPEFAPAPELDRGQPERQPFSCECLGLSASGHRAQHIGPSVTFRFERKRCPILAGKWNRLPEPSLELSHELLKPPAPES
jgi:hypothetical protein